MPFIAKESLCSKLKYSPILRNYRNRGFLTKEATKTFKFILWIYCNSCLSVSWQSKAVAESTIHRSKNRVDDSKGLVMDELLLHAVACPAYCLQNICHHNSSFPWSNPSHLIDLVTLLCRICPKLFIQEVRVTWSTNTP